MYSEIEIPFDIVHIETVWAVNVVGVETLQDLLGVDLKRSLFNIHNPYIINWQPNDPKSIK